MAKNEVSASIAAIDAFVAVLLEKISEGKRVISLQKGKRIFSQGDHADAIYADAIYFVQSGRAKISILCDQHD
jgi:CRP-like cAMP-binding protein